jgi:hypothetical protein
MDSGRNGGGSEETAMSLTDEDIRTIWLANGKPSGGLRAALDDDTEDSADADDADDDAVDEGGDADQDDADTGDAVDTGDTTDTTDTGDSTSA